MEELPNTDCISQGAKPEREVVNHPNAPPKRDETSEQREQRIKVLKKQKYKQRLKNRKQGRRVFLESMSIEERKAYITKERQTKLTQEQSILDQMHTAPKVYFDLSFCHTMIFKELRSLISQINACIMELRKLAIKESQPGDSTEVSDDASESVLQLGKVYSINLTSFSGDIKETWERCGVSKFI